MKGVSFVQHTKLTNVAGRIRYISSEEEQEYLYAVYDTAPEGFWQELARENQRDYKRSGTSGNCIEARELIIALPKVYYEKGPPHDKLLKYFVDGFKDKYDVECTAALHHNSWIDSLCSVVSILGVSIPSYVFALLLAFYIGFKLKWAPILYNTSIPFSSSVLPTIALAMFPMANISRFTRSEMIDVLGSDYISLVEAKGVKERPLIVHHALRNTLIPLVTIMGPLLVNLLTGSMVVEKVFAIPGIGMLMVQAIQSNDYNVVIACAFTYSAMYIIMMLIVDVLYGVIDPRIRVAKGGN